VLRDASGNFNTGNTTANAVGVLTIAGNGTALTNLNAGHLTAAMKLRPVNVRWKQSVASDFGFIAQEVRQVLPELVVGDESRATLTVKYAWMTGVAIGAIQEHQAHHDSEVDGFRSDNAGLNARLAAVKAALRKMARDST
jgi:hypothetical protein